MKILTKDKIVESFRFPFSEALSFAILVWTAWGLAEAFYWEKLAQLFDPPAASIDPWVYSEAFFLYLAAAAVITSIIYPAVKIIMMTLDRYEAYLFRGITLSLILAFFFLAVLSYYVPAHLFQSELSTEERYGITVALISFAVLLTIFLLKWASGVAFRIRRPGAMMLSIFAISVLLTFVRFPLFTSGAGRKFLLFRKPNFVATRSLTVYHYLGSNSNSEKKP